MPTDPELPLDQRVALAKGWRKVREERTVWISPGWMPQVRFEPPAIDGAMAWEMLLQVMRTEDAEFEFNAGARYVDDGVPQWEVSLQTMKGDVLFHSDEGKPAEAVARAWLALFGKEKEQ